MKVRGKDFLVLYLTDAQINLVKDVLGEECHYLTIPLGDEPVVRYRVRGPVDPEKTRLYFTNWQKREIADEAGESCDYIELTKSSNVKYGIPPETFLGGQ